ncbi:thiopurine S-methyltransferase [Veronia pacifica]|uniref:Thiopurine S-methyltransferase n=1 Tax=Veronia pacifica TaxID=1080227 RepID=A0A1C3EE53_9GAMM|nr:thiopurine S-methyltransferase [Veronia pacifica]ODA31474.1 thiopurine S-methyltransferase [Veronia pacifica]
MDAEFWHSRWAENRIGFNLNDTHPMLTNFWHTLSPKREERVFVPLCGKSVDLTWLSAQHEEVVGVELSEIATRAYFSEHLYTPMVTNLSAGQTLYKFDEVSIYCGDYFSAPVGEFSLIYDRAALIAMPETMRAAYVERLLSVLKSGGRILLITLNYPQDEMDGPPFSVSEDEVRQRFSGCDITLLNTDFDAQAPKNREISNFSEQAWLIIKR